MTISFSLTLFFDYSQSLSDTCEIRVYSNFSVDLVTSAITHFRRLSLVIYLQVLENEFNITGLEGIGFIISITIALSDTKLSFKHPNDTQI